MGSLTSQGKNNVVGDFGGSTKFNSSNLGRMKHPPSGLDRNISVEIFTFRPFKRESKGDLEEITKGQFTKILVKTTGKPHYDAISHFRYLIRKDESGKKVLEKIKGSEFSKELELYEGTDPETNERIYFTYKGELKPNKINRYGVSLDINTRSSFASENIHIDYALSSRKKYLNKR